MDVIGNYSSDGNNIQMHPVNQSVAQQFFVYNINGKYYFKTVNTNKMIDVDSGTKNVQIFGSGTGTGDATLYNARSFEIIKVSPDTLNTLVLKDGSSYSKSGTYVTKVKAKTTVKSVLGQFKNTGAVVYDKSGKQMSNESVCGTGCVVKLLLSGKVVDSLIIVVSGDVDGSGAVDSTDYMRVKSMFLGTYKLTGEYFFAGDADGSGSIDSTDYLRLKGSFLGTYTL